MVPGTDQNVVEAELLSSLVLKDGGHVGFAIEVGKLNLPLAQAETLRKACETAVLQSSGVKSATVVLTSEAPPKEGVRVEAKPAPKGGVVPPSPHPLAGVKHIIAVASGKGGVGKSTIACNLAVALGKLGYRVGLVDADIHGPSQARMMGVTQKPDVKNGRMIPPKAHGVVFMSMGLLLNEDVPVVWRGPMVGKALQQLMRGAEWGELDYMILDLPPGTGDIHLGIVQNFQLDGAIIITTPQDVALLDVKKAIGMFRKTATPLLGIVENMSYFQDAATGAKHYLFGKEGGKKLAEEQQIPLLMEIPIHAVIAKGADEGQPAVTAQNEPAGELFTALAQRITTLIQARQAQG